MATQAECEKWAKWLDAINDDGVNLSAREQEFIDSMNEKFERYGTNARLSDKQEEWLEDIYTNRVP